MEDIEPLVAGSRLSPMAKKLALDMLQDRHMHILDLLCVNDVVAVLPWFMCGFLSTSCFAINVPKHDDRLHARIWHSA
jgi:hypothetical protein